MSVPASKSFLKLPYKVSLTEKGSLQWTAQDENGKVTVLDAEPEASFWKSFKSDFIPFFVPEYITYSYEIRCQRTPYEAPLLENHAKQVE